VLSLLAVALAAPAAAQANDFQNVYREYKRTGTIKPCRFSDRQLANAEKQTPPDVEQYAPSFLDALQTARERNSGCGKKTAAQPAPAAAPSGGTPTPSVPTPVPQPTQPTTTPAPAATPPAPNPPVQPHVAGVASPPVAHPKRDDSAPAAVWLLAVLGALALIAAVLGALAWWFGWSADRWTRPFRASTEEFAGRARDFRVELTDWLRTGI
jgi:hypothetical protein